MTAHLKIQCHVDDMSLPHKAHSSDAGIDVTAIDVEQKQANVFFFDTGISVQVSAGYYVEVVPRSSIVKTDFIMANSENASVEGRDYCYIVVMERLPNL